MKDVFSAFGSESFRALATLVIPGMLPTGPRLTALALVSPPVWSFVIRNHVEAGIALVLLVTFFGLLLEDGGARLEIALAKNKTGDSYEQHLSDWYRYLRV